MKIVFLGPAYPYRGGPASFTDRLAEQFIAEGDEVNVLTFSLQYPSFLFPGKTQFTDKKAPDKFSPERVLNSVNPINWIIAGFRIRAFKPDILILRFWLPFFGPSLGTVARIVLSNCHTRVICIFDNVVPHEKRPGDRMLTRFFVSAVSGAIVMSHSVASDLGIFRRDLPVRFSPHPIFDNYGQAPSKDIARKKLEIPGGSKVILFFGFIRAYKGLDLLIRAMGILKGKGYRLLVAGEFYEDKTPYLDLLKQEGLMEETSLVDRFIEEDEVAYYFSAADIVVQPYKSATQSGVTQVAYHFGKPMIVTDVGGLAEIVSHGRSGYVVKPDPAEIAGAIEEYFNNDREKEMSSLVKEEKERFSWDKMTGAIRELYGKLTVPS
ncbi:MAG: glycosyltransferase [Bacteroidales bacterium]|nr:glycosyltransferase [Bacteroidales bacterium]